MNNLGPRIDWTNVVVFAGALAVGTVFAIGLYTCVRWLLEAIT